MTESAEARVARVRAVFDAWARDGQADGMADSHWPVARVALERLDLAPDARFLDIGCGNGYAVRWAAKVAPRGHALGIDVAPEMIALAKRLSVEYDRVAFRVARFPGGPATAPELGASEFDAIFSMEVFYYFPDLGGALRDTLNLLTPGGRFACAVDYYGENTASHAWPEEVGVPMTLLDQAGWRAAFEEAGFVRVRQERVRRPAGIATAEWQVTEGGLLTLGERA